MDPVIARHELNRSIRTFFYDREFLEVETPNLVPSPGTDVYIDPLSVELTTRSGRGTKHLHTSPEFAMKRLLADGYERIFQLCKTFRDSEDTEVHSPEFTMLEWYRSDVEVVEILNDVEDLCREVLPEQVAIFDRRVKLNGPWTRVSMQDLVDSVCDVDILECQTEETLREALDATVGLNPRASGSWDDMFFDMWVRHIDPVLRKMGVVFVCDWPARLAVLSQKGDDERLALRFELYIGGLELANGFQELTDAAEQRSRFEEDNATRRAQKRVVLPMPEDFLKVLESGFPKSAGVALGVDRLLMLQTGAQDIADVLNRA